MEAQAPPKRLNVRDQLVLSVFWLSLNAQNAALFPIVIPLQILLFLPSGQVGNAQQALLLGWISTAGAVVSLIMPPLFGMWSDNTRGAWGRRRPYIAVGALLLVLSALLLATAGSLALFVIALIINQIGSNAANASYQALLPDRVPKEQRGAASGYMGLMTIIGNIGSLGLAALLLNQVNLTSTGSAVIQRGAMLFYVITGIVLVAGAFITVVGVHEMPFVPTASEATRAQESNLLRFRRWFVYNWIAPWREYNFMLIFLTRFAVMMGLTLFMTFIEYYFADVANDTNFVQATAVVALLALAGAICSALVLGIYSDRVKRAPIVCVSTLFMAMASFAFVIAPGSFPLWILGILFGLGYGAYTSVDWALAIDAMPSLRTVGKDFALWGSSTNLSSILAPALGSFIIYLIAIHAATALGYRVVFAVATLFLLAGALFVLKIRIPAPDNV
ncbi:MAG TPA: MFS transporter [Ktedonobacteraceae bacterium]|nr:MFS transporter [Ktedonobacteraceae bacterium]